MALDFDGVGDRIDFPPIYTPLGNQFSFACRFNLSSLSGHEYFLLIESGATDFGLTVWLREDSGQRGIAVTCSGQNGSVLRYSTPQGFSTNRWYGLLVTWDGSEFASGIRIYLDDTELPYAGSQDGVAPLRAQDGDWIIAGRVADDFRNLSGRLADIGAWNSVLSSVERNSYFSGLVPRKIATNSLVFDVRLVDGNTTDSVTLQSGSIIGTPANYNQPTYIVDATALVSISNQRLTVSTSGAQLTERNLNASQSLSLFSQYLSATSAHGGGSSVKVDDYYEGGNVDVSRVIISEENSLNPIITLFARPNVNVEGATPENIYYSLACNITGVIGRTPKFKLNLTDSSPRSLYGSAGWPSQWRPWFSYDGVNWLRMSNSSVVGNFQEVSHSTPFSQDLVYFATRPPYNPSHVRSHIDGIRTSSFVSEPSSSSGNNFVYGQSAATTRDGDNLPVPALDLISYRVSDDTRQPLDGSLKRIAVLMAGQHASEDQGNWQLQAFVDYLLEGSAVSESLLRNWEFFVYPMINPSGRWGNAYRGSLQVNEKNQDPNRDWPGGETAGRLDVVTSTRTAIEHDTGNAISAFIDFHGRFRDTDSIFRFPNIINDNFISSVNSRYAVNSVVSTASGGVAETYFRTSFNVSLSVTSEGSGFVTAISDYSFLGRALAEALDEIFHFGFFEARIASTIGRLRAPTQSLYSKSKSQNRQYFVTALWL